jgi:biotin transport system permease protein
MTVLGVYLPGDSAVHRAPAWLKLVLLAVCGIASASVDRPGPGVALAGAALLGYRAAGLPLGVAGRRLRPLAGVIVLVGAVQLATAGWARATAAVAVLVALLLLAVLVSLTTPTDAMVGALVAAVHPLHRFGVDPERVGLQMALGIRAVPQVLELATTIRDAQRARGLGADPRAFAVPLVVRALRQADRIDEALRARGLDD